MFSTRNVTPGKLLCLLKMTKSGGGCERGRGGGGAEVSFKKWVLACHRLHLLSLSRFFFRLKKTFFFCSKRSFFLLSFHPHSGFTASSGHSKEMKNSINGNEPALHTHTHTHSHTHSHTHTQFPSLCACVCACAKGHL